MFKTLLELVELFCGCVRSLKETLSLGTTPSQSFPAEDLAYTCTQSLGLSGLLSGSRWNVASCSTLRYLLTDSSLLLLLSGTAVPVTCLLVFVCLVSFVLLSQSFLVSLFLAVIGRLCLYMPVAHLRLGGCGASALRWLEVFTRQGG